MTAPAKPPQGLVYVPACPSQAEGGGNVAFETRKQPDGTLLLPAYSSLTGLVEALGRYQPWVCVQLTQLAEALDGESETRLLVDPPVEPGGRRWTQADLVRSAGQTGQARNGSHLAELLNQPGADRGQHP